MLRFLYQSLMMKPQHNIPLQLRTGHRTELTTDRKYSIPYDNEQNNKNLSTTTTNHYESLNDLPFATYANIASCITTKKRKAPFPPKRDIKSHEFYSPCNQTDPLLNGEFEESKTNTQVSSRSKFHQWKRATMQRLALWLYEKSL